MNQSENISDLAKALCKAQADMPGAVTDSENPFFKSKYADLTSVWEACRKPLTDNGLSVVQTMSPVEQGVGVVTTLLHTSGQWIKGELIMQPNKNDPQSVGSCLTYNRRYSLSALVGICPEDDDGNEASKGEPEQKPQSTTAPGLTIIKKVTMKSGEYAKTHKRAGETWTKYSITDGNDKVYSTFSKTHAELAKVAMQKKAEVLITTKTERGYENIEQIEVIDTTTGEALEETLPVFDEEGNPI